MSNMHATELERLSDRIDRVIGDSLEDIASDTDEARAREIRDEITELIDELKAIITKDADAE